MATSTAPAPWTMSVETVYSYGPDGDAAPLVASDLRKDARDSYQTADADYAWLTDAKRADIRDKARRYEQAAAVIDELMGHGRAAVALGCALIGSELAPASLVALTLRVLAETRLTDA